VTGYGICRGNYDYGDWLLHLNLSGATSPNHSPPHHAAVLSDAEESLKLLQAMVWSAFNGLGLALVVPCIASLTADYHPAESRGRAFGLMAFTSGLGQPSRPPSTRLPLLLDPSSAVDVPFTATAEPKFLF
jgi:hypothetical protein